MSYELFLQKYDKKNKLGEGAYSSVYEILEKDTGLVYACKELIFDNNIIYCNYNEFIAHNEFDHPNIIKMYEIYCNETTNSIIYYIVMEKCDTSLSTLLLEDNIILSNKQRLLFLDQIISALIYMYNKGFVHNDLSLSNILIKDNQIKLIDFGFMYNKYIKREYFHHNTLYIQPPELIFGNNYICDSTKIDTWSLGNIFYTMCFNKILINGNNYENYFLDIISKICIPSVKIIKKYYLSKIYLLLYYKLILGKNINHSNLEDIISCSHLNSKKYSIDILLFLNKEIKQKHINLLSKYNFINNKSENIISKKTPEIIFIKKLLNWSVSYRPNIIIVKNLFDKLFCDIKFKKNIIIKPLKLQIKEYSLNKLLEKSKYYFDIFKFNGILNIHFKQDILNHSQYDYSLIIKSLYIMMKLYILCISKFNKFKCLGKIHYNNNKMYHKLSQIEKLELSFDRFYSLAHIIYYHHNNFNTYLLNKDSLQINDLLNFQHIFINLLDYKIPSLDPYDIYLKIKTKNTHDNIFKFIYYLCISNPNIFKLSNENITYAIILIITGYFENIVGIKLTNQYIKINTINNLLLQKYNFDLPNTSEIINCFEIVNNMYNIPTYCFNTDVVIISYYIVSIIKSLSDSNISRCRNYFGVSNKFLKYLLNFFDIINL
ncbi:kinase [Moumouvirus goulette]|uniref:Kinase n=1 Tax=Moumouvirus goulette TaxID=1247379 RepID=M1PNC8_9VIRU|nr:kinase [Moumouvirus goulette]AGF85496.1 kinase [Moumouvirus goulette]